MTGVIDLWLPDTGRACGGYQSDEDRGRHAVTR
jgi:hypothetical protein